MKPLSILFLKLVTNQLTDDEVRQLNQWIDSKRRRDIAGMIADPDELTREYRFRRMIDPARAEADMKRRIALVEAPRRRRRYAVAASVAALIGLGAWMLVQNKTLAPDLSEAETIAAVEPAAQIKPGEVKALIRNTDGSVVSLTDADSVVSRLVSFSDVAHANILPAAEKQLVLEVPRGGEFKIILEDSTEVWLNSESSLNYPEKFGKKERVVEVTGEAYFSVHKDASRPFYVIVGEQKIRVYGTTFNVRDYADDNLAYTTLETGSIALSRLDGQGGEIYLKPDHQAVFNKVESELTMQVVDASRISSWRHGRFVFEGHTLLNIMRDLARWYNFEFEFADPAIGDIRFYGNIPRYADFVTAITILENCGDISFNIEGSKVTVSQTP